MEQSIGNGLMIKQIEGKGRGVVATQSFSQGILFCIQDFLFHV